MRKIKQCHFYISFVIFRKFGQIIIYKSFNYKYTTYSREPLASSCPEVAEVASF